MRTARTGVQSAHAGLIGLNPSDHLSNMGRWIRGPATPTPQLQMVNPVSRTKFVPMANAIAVLSQRQFIKEVAGAIANQYWCGKNLCAQSNWDQAHQLMNSSRGI